jgi:hypothetical protein
MVAFVLTHPRGGAVTCMRADAKQKRGLTGFFSPHAQNIYHYINSVMIPSKKIHIHRNSFLESSICMPVADIP